MLEAALYLASLKRRVFPLRERGKEPALARGFKAASYEEKTVRAWWTRSPSANIGLATGEGLLVLDVDGLEGRKALRRLTRRFGSLPRTVEASTGKGRHLFFGYPPSKQVRLSAGKLGEGLDVRADGGYVVAPPSVHPSGRRYRWRRKAGRCALARAPRWLLRLLVPEGGKGSDSVKGAVRDSDSGSEPKPESGLGGWPADRGGRRLALVRPARVVTAAAETFWGLAFEAAGLAHKRRGVNANGSLDVTCPWVGEHTGGRDTGAGVLPATSEERWGMFWCAHGHGRKVERQTLALLGVLPASALREARRRIGRGFARARIVGGYMERRSGVGGLGTLARWRVKLVDADGVALPDLDIVLPVGGYSSGGVFEAVFPDVSWRQELEHPAEWRRAQLSPVGRWLDVEIRAWRVVWSRLVGLS